MKSWSSGSWGIVATGRRIFIKRGIISRKITEIPYSNISSIEYTRRYSWKTLIVGAVLSLLFLIEPALEPIFSRVFMSKIEFITGLFQIPAVAAFISILPAIPITIALLVFAWQARTGFTLRGPGLDPVYLPREFQDAIAFIRNAQNGYANKNKPTSGESSSG